MPPKKDEETLQREKEEKLEKLFKELDYSIEKEQYRLSKVVINAILKIDPNNLKVIQYIDKVPEQPEQSTRADIESFIKLGLILMTPGILIFLIFYKFLKKSEENNKDYFDDLEKNKKQDSSKKDKATEMKEALKKVENSLSNKNKDSSVSDKNKFKFSTIQRIPKYPYQGITLMNMHPNNQISSYNKSLLLQSAQTYPLQKCMIKVLRKLI